MAIITQSQISSVRDYLAGKSAGDEVTLDIKGFPVTDAQKEKGIFAKVGIQTPFNKEVIMTVQVLSCADAKYAGVILSAMGYSNGKENIIRPFTQDFEMQVLKSLHEHYTSNNDTLKEMTTLAAAGTLANQAFYKERKAKKATEAANLLNKITADAIASATAGATTGDGPIQ